MHDEITVTKERLHPGIFALVAIVTFVLCVPTIPALFMLNGFNKALASLNHHGASDTPLMFLLLIPDFLLIAGTLAVIWAAYVSCEITLTKRRIVFRYGSRRATFR